jgi:signal peptidase I
MAKQAGKAGEKAGGRFETAKALALAILLALGIRAFVVEPFTIPSGSMIPTLLVGDFIVVNKFAFGLRLPFTGTVLLPIGEPERGDVIVFRFPDDPSQDFIKRVIGVPGDRIDVRNGRLRANGQPLDEIPEGEYVYRDVIHAVDVKTDRFRETNIDGVSYTVLRRDPPPRDLNQGPWIVPDGHYFMVGDNRDNSADSRRWRNPFVRFDQIKGKAMIIHWFWIVSSGDRRDKGLVLGLLDTLWRIVTFQIEEVRWGRLGRSVHGVAD